CLLFPVFDLLLAAGITGVAIALKWLLIGQFKAGIKPAWSPYVWRGNIVEALFLLTISPLMLNPLMGTDFAAPLFRSLGAQIGKRVFIDTDLFTAFDLTEIANDAYLNPESTIQTHLFEDRILKLGPAK